MLSPVFEAFIVVMFQYFVVDVVNVARMQLIYDFLGQTIALSSKLLVGHEVII